ncbi:hypothetical protein [Dactylosporangium matsuzakiense]|nr:hypothetical protein [Dactylosporangium matsuzakiense]UWZ42329.1 hypothetical protein Dmats_32815 [Dactylosporangium matsuzakiense]
MTKHRDPLLTIVVAGVAALALTACGGDKTVSGPEPAGPASASAADPKAALAAAPSGLAAGDYAFTSDTPAAHTEGVVHLPSRSSTITSRNRDDNGSSQLRTVGADHWLRLAVDPADIDRELADIEAGGAQMKPVADGLRHAKVLFDGKTWMHTDLSRIKDDRLGPDLSDPDVTGVTKLFAAVLTAGGDARQITGTVDLSRAGNTIGYPAREVTIMGNAARSVPFTARLDDKGRLTHLELAIPATETFPAGTWAIDVTGYSAQQPVAKPTGVIKEMPADVYALLNS